MATAPQLNDLVRGFVPEPAPVRLPRPPIVRDFAVLLMRSSYEVSDELDFVPMDQFQREFFLFRAEQYEKYIRTNFVSHVLLKDKDGYPLRSRSLLR